MAVPVRAELIMDVDSLARRALACWHRNQQARRNELRSAIRALPDADEILMLPRQRIDYAGEGLRRALSGNAHVHRIGYSHIGGRLHAHLLFAQVERRRERFAGTALRLRAGVAANLAAHRSGIAGRRARVVTLAQRVERAIDKLMETRWARCERDAQLLAAFSYRGVLARGFALLRDRAGRPLRRAAAIAPGMPLGIELSDGHVGARVEVVQASTAPSVERAKRRARRDGSSGQGSLF